MQQQAAPLMWLLEQRVPITLLLDLVVIPDADEIYVTEGGSADWLAGEHLVVA